MLTLSSMKENRASKLVSLFVACLMVLWAPLPAVHAEDWQNDATAQKEEPSGTTQTAEQYEKSLSGADAVEPVGGTFANSFGDDSPLTTLTANTENSEPRIVADNPEFVSNLETAQQIVSGIATNYVPGNSYASSITNILTNITETSNPDGSEITITGTTLDGSTSVKFTVDAEAGQVAFIGVSTNGVITTISSDAIVGNTITGDIQVSDGAQTFQLTVSSNTDPNAESPFSITLADSADSNTNVFDLSGESPEYKGEVSGEFRRLENSENGVYEVWSPGSGAVDENGDPYTKPELIATVYDDNSVIADAFAQGIPVGRVAGFTDANGRFVATEVLDEYAAPPTMLRNFENPEGGQPIPPVVHLITNLSSAISEMENSPEADRNNLILNSEGGIEGGSSTLVRGFPDGGIQKLMLDYSSDGAPVVLTITDTNPEGVTSTATIDFSNAVVTQNPADMTYQISGVVTGKVSRNDGTVELSTQASFTPEGVKSTTLAYALDGYTVLSQITVAPAEDGALAYNVNVANPDGEITQTFTWDSKNSDPLGPDSEQRASSLTMTEFSNINNGTQYPTGDLTVEIQGNPDFDENIISAIEAAVRQMVERNPDLNSQFNQGSLRISDTQIVSREKTPEGILIRFSKTAIASCPFAGDGPCELSEFEGTVLVPVESKSEMPGYDQVWFNGINQSGFSFIRSESSGEKDGAQSLFLGTDAEETVAITYYVDPCYGNLVCTAVMPSPMTVLVSAKDGLRFFAIPGIDLPTENAELTVGSFSEFYLKFPPSIRILSFESVENVRLKAGDVNQDGKVDDNDRRFVLNALTGDDGQPRVGARALNTTGVPSEELLAALDRYLPGKESMIAALRLPDGSTAVIFMHDPGAVEDLFGVLYVNDNGELIGPLGLFLKPYEIDGVLYAADAEMPGGVPRFLIRFDESGMIVYTDVRPAGAPLTERHQSLGRDNSGVQIFGILETESEDFSKRNLFDPDAEQAFEEARAEALDNLSEQQDAIDAEIEAALDRLAAAQDKVMEELDKALTAFNEQQSQITANALNLRQLLDLGRGENPDAEQFLEGLTARMKEAEDEFSNYLYSSWQGHPDIVNEENNLIELRNRASVIAAQIDAVTNLSVSEDVTTIQAAIDSISVPAVDLMAPFVLILPGTLSQIASKVTSLLEEARRSEDQFQSELQEWGAKHARLISDYQRQEAELRARIGDAEERSRNQALSDYESADADVRMIENLAGQLSALLEGSSVVESFRDQIEAAIARAEALGSAMPNREAYVNASIESATAEDKALLEEIIKVLQALGELPEPMTFADLNAPFPAMGEPEVQIVVVLNLPEIGNNEISDLEALVGTIEKAVSLQNEKIAAVDSRMREVQDEMGRLTQEIADISTEIAAKAGADFDRQYAAYLASFNDKTKLDMTFSDFNLADLRNTYNDINESAALAFEQMEDIVNAGGREAYIQSVISGKIYKQQARVNQLRAFEAELVKIKQEIMTAPSLSILKGIVIPGIPKAPRAVKPAVMNLPKTLTAFASRYKRVLGDVKRALTPKISLAKTNSVNGETGGTVTLLNENLREYETLVVVGNLPQGFSLSAQNQLVVAQKTKKGRYSIKIKIVVLGTVFGDLESSERTLQIRVS